ncbi:MAG: hypothetical protein WCD11_22330 [Solirubrobacteraceae bacterium]
MPARVAVAARGWIVGTERAVLSEHPTATEAENAALARLRDGDELLIVDRYLRCHRSARLDPTRSSPRLTDQPPPLNRPEAHDGRGIAPQGRRGGANALVFSRERW